MSVGEPERVVVRYVLGTWEVRTRLSEVTIQDLLLPLVGYRRPWPQRGWHVLSLFAEPNTREDEPRHPPSHPPGAPVAHGGPE